MTTIIAVRDSNRTLIGSDTMVQGNGLKQHIGSKWARFGHWGVGVSGDRRTNNICDRHAKRLLDDLSGAFEFTERFSELLREYKYDMAPADQAAPPNGGQTLILACPDNIWSIGGDMSIIECERYWAEGSGRRFALGAMYALRKEDAAHLLLTVGLEAAMEYDTNTGGEIWSDYLEA